MTTYKERQENLQMYVLQEGCEVLGTFGNLKKVCDYLEEQNKDFYSYNTAVRKKEYPISKGEIKIYKVKHH